VSDNKDEGPVGSSPRMTTKWAVGSSPTMTTKWAFVDSLRIYCMGNRRKPDNNDKLGVRRQPEAVLFYGFGSSLTTMQLISLIALAKVARTIAIGTRGTP
jgi:hypothetical protein